MTVLLALALLQLLPPPALLQIPRADYWDDWGPYGECSRSCGSGVTVRTRRCITQRADGGSSCVGPAKSYRTCNIQDCPEGSRDFREEQCSQFDGMDFQGKRYRWLPYYGENPCELNCIPKGENFFYRHQPAVVDGTPCHPGRRDICVEGICKRLGCDNILESAQEEDPCLQCGGNGESCQLVQGTFNMRALPAGYNQMFIIPVGATTISVRETVATRNYLAVKNLRGEYYLNGHWVIDFSRATPIGGTTLYYQRSAEGVSAPETITGRGPTTEPLVIELISQEENQGVEYEYYMPPSRGKEGYFWSYGSWSDCSKDCGSGYQSRLVFCAIDNEAYPDYFCDDLPHPLTNRTCNLQSCPQTRRWKVGEWSSCSATCGGGTQTRSVYCLSHDAGGSRTVEDSLCAAYSPQPVTQQSCNLQQCAEYSMSRWSQCSVTCGTGEQTRDVVCMGAAGVRLPDFACSSRSRPARAQPCQMAACYHHIAWHIGDWGLCSKSCGSGLRERQVICSDRERNLYGAEKCEPYPKPSTLELCNTQPCFSAQVVPSMQDPRGYDNTLHGFLPFMPEDPTRVHRQDNVEGPRTAPHASHCSLSYYGCCPDGHTVAPGPQGQGCLQQGCLISNFGCCQDGVTAAQGPHGEGCAQYRVQSEADTSVYSQPGDQCGFSTFGCCYDLATAASGPQGEGCGPPGAGGRAQCSLPHTLGPCSDWTSRYYHDPATRTCKHFWYGGCQGNRNNFLTKEECERECQDQAQAVPVSGRAELSASVARDMRRVFTVQRGWVPGASTQTHSSGAFLRTRHAQRSSPPASRGVSIDTADPSRVEGAVGQTVLLPCRVRPLPSSTVVVEWRRNGELVPAARHHTQPDGSLLVGPLSLHDSGWLLCVATSGRERDHRYIHLSVSEEPSPAVPPSPPHYNATEHDRLATIRPPHAQVPAQKSPRFSIDHTGSSLLEVRAGQSARLPCRVSPASSRPALKIEWTRDGHPLPSPRHRQHSDGSLIIGQVTSGDSGYYTCTVSSHSRRDQRQLQLKVIADLRITTAPNNIQVSQGSTAHLPCVVSGEDVHVGWSRNGVPVRPDGGRVQVSSDGSLILNNMQPLDEGSYTCNAYVGTYSVSATAEVRVTKESQPGLAAGPGVSSQCVDQPDLANCELIVYARLCSNAYYSSFCCASCARNANV